MGSTCLASLFHGFAPLVLLNPASSMALPPWSFLTLHHPCFAPLVRLNPASSMALPPWFYLTLHHPTSSVGPKGQRTTC